MQVYNCYRTGSIAGNSRDVIDTSRCSCCCCSCCSCCSCCLCCYGQLLPTTADLFPRQSKRGKLATVLKRREVEISFACERCYKLITITRLRIKRREKLTSCPLVVGVGVPVVGRPLMFFACINRNAEVGRRRQ